MATGAGTLTAVQDRPIKLRKRPDLTISTSVFQQEVSWIVKDPISLEYHRLREAEITVLEMLDGKSTLRDVKNALQDKYPTKMVRLADLQNLLATFHRTGLVVANTKGQAQQLLHRKREKDRRKLMGTLSNVLAIRLPGFDPERILNWLHPKIGFIFRPWFMLVWLVLATSAGALILSNYTEFQQRLPDFYQFFNLQNFALMAGVMAVTKVGHEFGHGLSCKHFGGECHEIGMLLLVFTPALYCDTSDSWLVKSKWHRAFIGAAGMYVEVLFASIATFFWWYSRPGTFNFVCLNVMFVSSVSTVVFNMNPLLRYDGYYILSDIMEIPNLAQKARLGMMNLLRVQCLGMKPVSPRRLPQRGHFWFVLYSVASFAYRWFILGAIVWFIYKMFEPYGLEIIGHSIIAVSVTGLVIMPLWKLIQFFAVPGRIQEVKPQRFAVTSVVVSLLLAAIFFMPLPHRVWSTLVVKPDMPQRIYASVGGTLAESYVKTGDAVEAGQLIARLENPQLELRLAQVEGEVARNEVHLRNLKRMVNRDPQAGGLIQGAETALADAKEQLAQLQVDMQRLELKAERDGVLIPPPQTAEQIVVDEDAPLPTWHGTPLMEANQGALMTTGTLLCMVGDPQEMVATLMVKQDDIELVLPGQSVTIVLDELPSCLFEGEIREVAKLDLRVPPRELTAAAGGALATEQVAGGGEKPMFVTYEARVPLHDVPEKLLPGFRGQAKIEVGSETLAGRIARFIRATFFFR
jgi:putative peptide zinc metalloprotease protein